MRALAHVSMAALIAIGTCGGARAEGIEHMLKRRCARPRYLVTLSESQAKSLDDAASVLTGARLCKNLEKPEPPREPGCLVENVVAGGTFDALKLKSGDFVPGTSEGPANGIGTILKTIGAIAKSGKGCFVVTREDRTFGIGYNVKKRARVP